MNPFDELKQKMETPEFEESARKYMEEYFGRIEKNREKVSSKEYIEWIYNYVSDNKHANDESALYTYEGVDAENGQLLSAFLDYIEDLAKQQRVLIVPDDECDFGSEQVVVRIKNKYFEIFRMYGQGSWTSVRLLDKEPDCAFVKIPC